MNNRNNQPKDFGKINYKISKLANLVYKDKNEILDSSREDVELRWLVDLGDMELNRQNGNGTYRIHRKVLLSYCMIDKVLFLSFRGTSGIKDYPTDLNISMKQFVKGGKSFGNVHNGFLSCIQSFKNEIDEVVKIIYDMGEVKIVHVTGHSLGGALAVLYLALSINESDIKFNSITTFGQPKVGDKIFSQWFKSILESNKCLYYRHVNKVKSVKGDLVARLPFSILGYHHTNGHLVSADKTKNYVFGGEELDTGLDNENQQMYKLWLEDHKMDLYQDVAKCNEYI